jgi:outer membrane protein
MRLWIAVLAIVSATGVVSAEPAQPLTEQWVVQTALERSPVLRAAAAELGMARARTGMAQAEGRLQVSVNALAATANMPMTLATPVMPQALLVSQDRASADLNAMAMYPLITSGRLGALVRAAQSDAAAAESDAAATRVEVAAESRMRLAMLRQALAMVGVADATLTAQRKNADFAQALYDAGKVPKFDLLRAQAALSAAQLQVANAGAEVTVARAQLAQTLGVPAESLGDTSEEAVGTPLPNPLEAALAHRPEVRAAQRRVDAAAARLEARAAGYRPQVSAVGMVDLFSPANMDQTSGYAVGLTAGVPLVTSGRKEADLAEARQGIDQAGAMLATVELQVRAEVACAQARLEAATQNLDTAAAQLRSADEAYQVGEARYAAGKGTIVELLDSLQALREGQAGVATSRAQYDTALAELYRAAGVAVPGEPAANETEARPK